MKIKKSIFKNSFYFLIFIFSESAIAHGSANHVYRLSDHFHWDRSQGVLFENFLSSTYALQLIQNKDKFEDHDFIFGGLVDVDVQHWDGEEILIGPNADIYSDGNGLYITQTTFDVMNKWNPWITAFASGTDTFVGSNNPDGDTIYSPNAFLALGNLDRFPFYFVAGISAIPFGIFGDNDPWNAPLTEAYFNPAQAPILNAGFYKAGWNLSIGEFKDQVNYEDHSVFNLSYNNHWDHFGLGAGFGYLTNYQINASTSANIRSTSFHVFSDLGIGDIGNVIDLNGSLSYRAVTVNAEYDEGSRAIGSNTADPDAYSVVLNIIKKIAKRDTTFGLGYSETSNLNDVPNFLSGNDGLSLALSGLKSAWSFNISRPIFTDNIILTLDYQRTTTNPSWEDQLEKNSNTYTVDVTGYL